MPETIAFDQPLRAVAQSVRRPEALATRWQARPLRARVHVILALLGTAVFGVAVYGAFMRLHLGAPGMLSGAVRAPLAAGLAWALALPALYIVGGVFGSALDAGVTLMAASISVSFGALAMLASVPVIWFFGLALPSTEARVAVNLVVFAGVGVAMSDTFLRVMAALEPEGSVGFRLAWLGLLGVIGAELFLLFDLFSL